MIKPYNRAKARGENRQTRLRLWEMHPYPRFAVLAPGGGSFSGTMLRAT